MRATRALLVAVVVAALSGLALSSVAVAQAPVPTSPPNWHTFAWEQVETSGIGLVLQAPPGLSLVEAEVSRDAGLGTYADYVLLHESAPGRYEGTALLDMYEPGDDAGTYYWRAYYNEYDPATFTYRSVSGPIQAFSVRPPYRAPRLRLATRARPYLGRQHWVVVTYRPGSDPQADRVHVLTTPYSGCPAAPAASTGRRLIADAEPPAGAEMDTPVRYGALGVFRVCAYVTSNGQVTERVARRVEVVRPPVSKRRMLRWRLSARGLGPIRIGMTIREIEEVTGRDMLHGYGDYSSCQQWSLAGIPSLSLMRAYGRLARIEAWRGRWRSSGGIRIGDSAAKVRRRHRVVRTEPHPYTPPGRYLITGGSRRRMIFETNPAGRVTSFRGGRGREVSYIEGCA